jgi:hypothetical protein
VTTADAGLSYRGQQAQATALATLIVLGFVVWLGIQVPKGILTNTDELLTAERSREMLLTTPWVVHFNFEKSFAKPPLQYWLTTLTLPRFENRTLAVRIWPLVYGALTAITLALLAGDFDRSCMVACRPSRPVFSGWLIASIVFAVVATAVWPLFQLARYGMPVGSVFHQEVVVWLGPDYLGARPYLEIPFRLGLTAWIGGGLFAIIAPLVVLLWRKQRFPKPTKEIAILCSQLLR